uniref:H-type lectin domain-containing protein n=1 Tax=Branchiostoma floridae TaxID=7739 RepID=C3XRP8_BRAFL|eukprot:XP_002613357.1 hypothetical protein BRAFLDRAFT_68342 [Branchiostoma floridae]
MKTPVGIFLCVLSMIAASRSAAATGDLSAPISLETALSEVQGELRDMKTQLRQLQERSIVACDSGYVEVPANSHLYTGSGVRYLEIPAYFSRSFSSTPTVTVGLSHLDHNPGTNTRIDVTVVSVRTSSITIRIETWATSHVVKAGVNWMACA